MLGVCFSCSIPPPPPPPPPSSTTTSSTQYRLHTIINTTPSTLHHQKQHHQHSIINTPSTQHHQHYTIYSTSWKQQHQHNIINMTPSRQHHLISRGRCSTWSTSVSFSVAGGIRRICREVRGSPATIEYYGRRLLLEDLSLILRGRCSTRSITIYTTSSNTTSSSLIGEPQFHFAWQVQHSEHLSVIFRRRCSTRSTSWGLRKAGNDWVLWSLAAFAWQVPALGGPQSHFAWQAALGASQCHFARQVQHSQHLQRGRGSPTRIKHYGGRLLLRGKCSMHLEDLSLILRCRCSTWRTSISSCVAGAATMDASCFCVAGCSTWRNSVSFCVAGGAVGASQCHFAWQVQPSR